MPRTRIINQFACWKPSSPLAEAQTRFEKYVERAKRSEQARLIGNWTSEQHPDRWKMNDHPSCLRPSKSRGDFYLKFTRQGGSRGIGNSPKNWSPLPQPMLDFAKAVVIEQMAQGVYSIEVYRVVVLGIRALVEVSFPINFEPFRLSSSHFEMAEEWAYSHFKTPIGQISGLVSIAGKINRWGLTMSPIEWTPKREPPPSAMSFNPADTTGLKSKLPSPDVIRAIANIWRDPRLQSSKGDLACMAMIMILLSTGIRMAELESLEFDCLWSEECPRDSDGLDWLDAQTGEPVVVWYLGRLTAKNGPSAPRVIDPAFESLVQEAVSILKRLSGDARAAAAWMEAHPGRLPFNSIPRDSPPLTLISTPQLFEDLGFSNPSAVSTLLRRYKVKAAQTCIPIRTRSEDGRIVTTRPSYYWVHEIEGALRPIFDNQFLIDCFGRRQLHSSRLLLFFDRFFFNRPLRENCLLPQAIPTLLLRTYFVGTHTCKSIFERYEQFDETGKPFRITSHQFRHLVDTLATLGGMPDEYRAMLQGRKTYQNKYYVHLDRDQQSDALIQLNPTELADQMRRSIRGGLGLGQIAESYRTMPVTKREAFLSIFVSEAHQTPFGVCLRPLSLYPCDRQGACVGCRHWMVERGNNKHLQSNIEIRDMYQWFMAALEEQYGADAMDDPQWKASQRIVLGAEKAIRFIGSSGTAGESVTINPEGDSFTAETRWE